MKRYLIVWFIGLPILLVLMPAALVSLFSPPSNGSADVAAVAPHAPASNRPPIEVKVYRTNKKTVETVPLETYIEGVVAAEMPAEFEMEALKAQAMAARTYIVRRLSEKKFDDVPAGAQVLDTSNTRRTWTSSSAGSCGRSSLTGKTGASGRRCRRRRGWFSPIRGNRSTPRFFPPATALPKTPASILKSRCPI